MIAPEVVADWLSVTTPFDDSGSLVDAVESVCDISGAASSDHDPSDANYRLDDGLLRLRRRGRVLCVTASGRFLRALRDRGLFVDYLSALGSEPHRVTRLDAAVDVPVDAGEFLPPVVELAESEAVSLGRKRIPRRRVRYLRHRRDDGTETGSLYLNGHGARLSCVVYDKALEALEKRGEVLPPTTRIELRFSDVGLSLRDAYDPAPLFWHYCPREVLRPASPVPPWEPAGSGFSLPAPVPRSARDRLRALADRSGDLGRLCALAAAEGPEAVEYLVGLVRARVSQAIASPRPASAAAPSGLPCGPAGPLSPASA